MGKKKGNARRVYYEVGKGIPIPPKKLHHEELWASMEVGDSILFPNARCWKAFQSQVKIHRQEYYFEKGANDAYREKKKPWKEMRVWKVKEEE